MRKKLLNTATPQKEILLQLVLSSSVIITCGWLLRETLSINLQALSLGILYLLLTFGLYSLIVKELTEPRGQGSQIVLSLAVTAKLLLIFSLFILLKSRPSTYLISFIIGLGTLIAASLPSALKSFSK